MTAEAIVARVAKLRGMAVSTLRFFGPHARYRTVARARFECMWLMRRHAGMSFPEIGAYLGGRHHTTVMSGVAKIECDLTPGYRAELEALAAETSFVDALRSVA